MQKMESQREKARQTRLSVKGIRWPLHACVCVWRYTLKEDLEDGTQVVCTLTTWEREKGRGKKKLMCIVLAFPLVLSSQKLVVVVVVVGPLCNKADNGGRVVV